MGGGLLNVPLIQFRPRNEQSIITVSGKFQNNPLKGVLLHFTEEEGRFVGGANLSKAAISKRHEFQS